MSMGKITVDCIRMKLAQMMQTQIPDLQWKGINIDIVTEIENVQPILSNDFHYEGSGEYEFSGHIAFMVKDTNNEYGTHREKYRIFPCSKMSIKEVEDGFNIDITSPILLQKI